MTMGPRWFVLLCIMFPSLVLFVLLSIILWWPSYETVHPFANTNKKTEVTCYYHTIELPTPNGIMSLGTQAVICGYDLKSASDKSYFGPDLETWIKSKFGEKALAEWKMERSN